MLLLSVFKYHLVTLCFFGAFAAAATAQTLEIPRTWLLQDMTLNVTSESRESLALSAATALFNEVNPSGDGVTPAIPFEQYLLNLFAVLALQDYRSGKTTWMNNVTQIMQLNYRNKGVYGDPTGLSADAGYWALAFYYAYKAYRQDTLLNTAIEIYNETNTTSFITPIAAALGNGAGRNVSFILPSNCADGTIAGGVFETNAIPSDLDICAECVGSFMTSLILSSSARNTTHRLSRLSAYLYEETGDLAYYQAAQLSVDFMIQRLWNGTIFLDTFRLSDCTIIPGGFGGGLTLNQANFIEGLSVLANVTKNTTLTSFLESAVASTTTFPIWSSDSGIITEYTEPLNNGSWGPNLKGLFIRGLMEASTRNPNTDLSRYIEAYITIQFNSLLSNAQGLDPNTNFYATSWLGPRASSFSSPGNIGALDVLNAVVAFAPSNGSNASSSANPTGSGPTVTKRKPFKTGPIVGGAVGGAVIVCVATLILWHRRRIHARRNATISVARDPNSTNTVSVVEPFTNSPPAGPPSKWQRFYEPSQYPDAHQSPSTTRQPNFASTSTPAGDNSREGLSGVSVRPGWRENASRMQEVGQVERNGLDDLPNIVGRLVFNILHGHQGELPPAYED